MKIIKEISKAQKLIKNELKKTPLIYSEDIGKKLGINLYFKPECFQKTNSFKIRGVLNKLHYLSTSEKRRGLITLSTGSHAISLAFAASRLRIPLIVAMPKNAPLDKIKTIKKYGAKIIMLKENLRAKCQKIQKQHKLTMIHPFDDPLIIAGQGTIGLEILEELPCVDMVFVPVGGGGLISGIATAIKAKKPETKIIGVESVNAPVMFRSVRENKIIRFKTGETVAECLAAPYVGKYTLKYTKKYVDDIVLVSDADIVKALRLVWQKHKIKVEPAGAVSLAAIISKKVKLSYGKNVVCVLSGGNISKKGFLTLIKK